jgi:hypothetical protein
MSAYSVEIVFGRCGGCLELAKAAAVAVYFDEASGGATPYVVCSSCARDLRKDPQAFAERAERNLEAARGQGVPRRGAA